MNAVRIDDQNIAGFHLVLRFTAPDGSVAGNTVQDLQFFVPMGGKRIFGPCYGVKDKGEGGTPHIVFFIDTCLHGGTPDGNIGQKVDK